jgi:signal transduction histidine kinase/DNA-binding response OmpR family regulator
MTTPVKLLVIDDDDADRLQLKRALKTCGFPYELTEYEEVRTITGKFNEFDCIFLDYLLPGENGLLLLKKFSAHGIKTPIVIITSQGNESIAVELMKAGASDYIVKNDISGQSLGQVIRNTIRIQQMLRAREEAENALRISEARLAEAQRIASIGNWEYEPGNNTIYWSSQVYDLFDIKDRDFIPSIELVVDLIHEQDRRHVGSFWADALKGKAFELDFRIVTSRGVKYINSQGYALCGPEGGLKKIVGTLQDITQRKLSEQELLKAREIAENSTKVKEIFLANMSHEIRTPMNAILGFTRMLYETPLTEEQLGYLDAINFSSESLLVIINDILDYSKIQSGKVSIEKCDFSLHKLAQDIITMLRPKASDKGLALSCKVDKSIPEVLKGDPVRLNQILTNLLSNAIKFTESGSVGLEIVQLLTKDDCLNLQFKVRDTGIGIPADKQAVVFDSFVQASDDTTRKYGGTGLGLSIVKSLVELQHGNILIESEPGHGTTFIVNLSLDRANHTAVTSVSPSISRPEEVEQISRLAILVVEDNPVNQLLVRKVLEKVNCKIDIARNGLEAIALLKSKDFDIVLMDVQMPEMDGYEATQYIRTQLPSPYAQLPIIAMTAHAFGEDVTRCLAVGMNDYISKPFKSEDLYLKILQYTIGIKGGNPKFRKRIASTSDVGTANQ